MHSTGVDAQTFVTFEYEGGAMAHLECGFTGSLPNDVTIVGETGYIRTSRECHGVQPAGPKGHRPSPLALSLDQASD